MRRGSVSIAPTSRSTAEPRSPSTIRWSKDNASVVTWRTASAPSCTQRASLTWPSARIAASPGVRMGVFGVDAGTPILTPGEAAILALGQVREMPWVYEGEIAVRQVTTLALSFDHRIVDGDLGSAFLRDVGAMLTDPLRMLAWS